MKKFLSVLIIGLFSIKAANAESCKVVRIDVFNLVTEPSLPDGSTLGASSGQILILKEDQVTVVPVGGSQSGYLFLAADHKTSHLVKMDESLMSDYMPAEMNDGRVVIGSKTGELNFLDHDGNLLSKLSVVSGGQVTINLVEKDDSLLVTSVQEGALYRVSPYGMVTKLITQPQFLETFATISELSDGHISVNFFDTDEEGSNEILNSDGSFDFALSNNKFIPNPFQPVFEISPGVLAIVGTHVMQVNVSPQASIAYVDIASKQITYADFGIGREVFIQKMKNGDHMIVFNTGDGKETIQYFHGTEKMWEQVAADGLNDLGLRIAELSDATIINTMNEKLQFLTPKGEIRAEFDFTGLDKDPTSHRDQYPLSPIQVLADDTVMVSQWFFQGLRFSYLKLQCE